jgi:hypothetical protein
MNEYEYLCVCLWGLLKMDMIWKNISISFMCSFLIQYGGGVACLYIFICILDILSCDSYLMYWFVGLFIVIMIYYSFCFILIWFCSISFLIWLIGRINIKIYSFSFNYYLNIHIINSICYYMLFHNRCLSFLHVEIESVCVCMWVSEWCLCLRVKLECVFVNNINIEWNWDIVHFSYRRPYFSTTRLFPFYFLPPHHRCYYDYFFAKIFILFYYLLLFCVGWFLFVGKNFFFFFFMISLDFYFIQNRFYAISIHVTYQRAVLCFLSQQSIIHTNPRNIITFHYLILIYIKTSNRD